MYFIYLLANAANRKTYVGYTSKKPQERLKEHNQGRNDFTSKNGPWHLVYYESFFYERCARAREAFFKTGVGKKLRKIIVSHYDIGA